MSNCGGCYSEDWWKSYLCFVGVRFFALISKPFNKEATSLKKKNLQADEMKLATQVRGVVLPVKQLVRREKARAVTDDEKKFEVYKYLRRVRADKRLKGAREKKAREAAEDGGIGAGRR